VWSGKELAILYYNTTIVTDFSEPIGFIGLGRMGGPMARRLAAAGHTVLAYDPAPGALERLAGVAGIEPRASAGDCAEGVGTVVLMLPTSAVVTAVLRDEVLARLQANAIVLDMSSSEPTVTRLLASEVEAAAARLVDAPVSGGTAGAEAGTLTIMVGGSEADVEAVRPTLDRLGSKVLHVGPVGAGHALKALNNLLSATSLLVSCEAIAIGERFGLDPAVMIDALNGSTGRSGSTEVKLPKFILSGTFDSGFDYDLMVKDVKTALDLAAGMELPARLGERTLELWQEARTELGEAPDHTEIGRALGLP
jgi:3-hydroxyisobutyrate dehydrogenase